MDDGAHTIFLSTKGTNEDEEPEELVKFLKFVGAQPSESEKDFEDAFVKRLQNSVREVKASREMGARYMTFQELLKDEREAGRKEGEQIGEQNKLISQVQKKLAKGKSVEEIADALEESIETIQTLIDSLQ